jgi:Hemolysins and related proteins containing CBS domains
MSNLIVAALILFVIILIGIVFDIIGIAVTSASEVPFVSMASKKIRGAKEAIRLIRKADQVSSFCNDVVGDICGIISGAAGGVLTLKIIGTDFTTLEESLLSIIISSLIAALTVAGKALGKSFAIINCDKVVYYTAYFLSLLNEKIDVLNGKKNSKGNAVMKAREN